MTKTLALDIAAAFAFVVALLVACFGTAAILLAHEGHLTPVWTDRGAVALIVAFLAYLASDLLTPCEDEPAEAEEAVAS